MLLEPGKIGDLELPNRIMLSPHGSNTGGELGQVTDETVAYYGRRAEGEAGAIIIGTVRVATKIDSIKMMARQLCIDRSTCAPSFQRLTEAIHRAGSKAIIQIQVGGGGNVGTSQGDWDSWFPGTPLEPVSPSGISFHGRPKPRELSTSEVETIVELAAKGAYRAKVAEFDAIEVNAHPFIISGLINMDRTACDSFLK